ncbi:Bax inhibitor-1/YccA family membrane protein [Streptomyces sp. YJ-C3]
MGHRADHRGPGGARHDDRLRRRAARPEDSWAAAFGLVLTLLWLYVETLRLLTLVREDDVY